MNREPAVAGQFYSGSPLGLKQQVRSYLIADVRKQHAIGMVCPHAGFIYSGGVAGAVYSAVVPPNTFVLLGPNHTGIGAAAAMYGSGQWQIPTALFSIDAQLGELIRAKDPLLEIDASAHAMEHSLEVQLPFIAETSPSARILPIALRRQSLDECRLLGEAVAAAIRECGYPVTIVSSTDMSHYVNVDTARRLDHLALEHIIALDPEGLYATVHSRQISMCGIYPTTTMLFAARSLGAKQAQLLQYATSGEVSGDYAQVVGYAGLIIA
ncbi:MAG TPA: AmmeMemoRadiSam system protein B [Dissulfurispiraceae bacterium]|nr:AmmeMemoRadiSam system protein B [Dissulfurispiraceae bacterium]